MSDMIFEELRAQHERWAAAEAGITDLKQDDNRAGFLIKETDTHLIFVMRMLVNWRLHTIRKPRHQLDWSERFWCYEGTDELAFIAAYLAAKAWDGADGTEPVGWNKNGQTGEFRPRRDP